MSNHDFTPCPHVQDCDFEFDGNPYPHFGIQWIDASSGRLKARVPHTSSECRIAYHASNEVYRIECHQFSSAGSYGVIESSVVEQVGEDNEIRLFVETPRGVWQVHGGQTQDPFAASCDPAARGTEHRWSQEDGSDSQSDEDQQE